MLASSTEPECGGTQSNDGIVVQVWPAQRQQQSRDVEQEKYTQTGTSDLQKTKVKLRAWRCECVSVWACACVSQSEHVQITLTNAMVMRQTCWGFFSLPWIIVSGCILLWEFESTQYCFRIVWFVHSAHFGTWCFIDKRDKMLYTRWRVCAQSRWEATQTLVTGIEKPRLEKSFVELHSLAAPSW